MSGDPNQTFGEALGLNPSGTGESKPNKIWSAKKNTAHVLHEACNRRDFLRIGAAAGLSSALASGLSLPGCASLAKASPAPAPDMSPIDRVRIGFVGVGGRGPVSAKF